MTQETEERIVTISLREVATLVEMLQEEETLLDFIQKTDPSGLDVTRSKRSSQGQLTAIARNFVLSAAQERDSDPNAKKGDADDLLKRAHSILEWRLRIYDAAKGKVPVGRDNLPFEDKNLRELMKSDPDLTPEIYYQWCYESMGSRRMMGAELLKDMQKKPFWMAEEEHQRFIKFIGGDPKDPKNPGLMNEKYDFEFPKGASNVISQGKEFVAIHGSEKLGEVAKVGFKTTKQVLSLF